MRRSAVYPATNLTAATGDHDERDPFNEPARGNRLPRDSPRAERYYGAQTARAVANFPISGVPIARLPHLLRSLAQVKIAAAKANCDEGGLAPEKRDAIIAACREVIAGEHDAEFPVDVLQGGAGTSTNMNMNEVIANRASEILGGASRLVHANDEVTAPNRQMTPMRRRSGCRSLPRAGACRRPWPSWPVP
ncbi:lyase family protein [Mesorhizobium sp. BHbdii]